MIYVFLLSFLVKSENSEVFLTYICVFCSSDQPKNTVVDRVFVTKIYRSAPFTNKKVAFQRTIFLKKENHM